MSATREIRAQLKQLRRNPPSLEDAQANDDSLRARGDPGGSRGQGKASVGQKRDPSPEPIWTPNVVGSAAAATSADFHIYKKAKRKEFDRKKMEEAEEMLAAERLKGAEIKAANEQRDRARTEKNRNRRLKRKNNRVTSKPSTDNSQHPNQGSGFIADLTPAAVADDVKNNENSDTNELSICEPSNNRDNVPTPSKVSDSTKACNIDSSSSVAALPSTTDDSTKATRPTQIVEDDFF